ncbi:MAG: prepilin-type N-terminal cleavage/methylation domain-containing protein [Butyricicoccus pullicaecorum]|nr:prepilin-type N-terminal cleavage/methylation domain-containing protein [Butyricicoccus pullicaecorum]
MMEKMIALQQKRRSKKGGFTLVELIVVLVILAILAALLIPALTGYIDKAKQKNVLAETRQVVMAAQTLADEDYANGIADATGDKATCKGTNILSLAELTGKGTISDLKVSGGKVTKITFTETASKYHCTYEDGSYGDVTKK